MTPEEKVAAGQAVEAAKELKKRAAAEKAKDAHLFARVRLRVWVCVFSFVGWWWFGICAGAYCRGFGDQPNG